MFSDPHETARTQFAQVGDVRFAYRRFGRPRGLLLLLVNYWAANMDDWDPKLTNGFAAEREVILFDNAGVAGSTGETPSTVMAMTRSCVDFCRGVGLTKLDVLGFSLGGMIAQQLAFEYPEMVRRMILVGPRAGQDAGNRCTKGRAVVGLTKPRTAAATTRCFEMAMASLI